MQYFQVCTCMSCVSIALHSVGSYISQAHVHTYVCIMYVQCNGHTTHARTHLKVLHMNVQRNAHAHTHACIVLTKTFAVETSTFYLSFTAKVFVSTMHCTDEDLRGRNVYISICLSLLRDCSKFAQSFCLHLCFSQYPWGID